MNKKIPYLLLGGGLLLVLLAVFVIVKSFKSEKSDPSPTQEVIADLPESQRPAVILSPVADPSIPNSLGHVLGLKIQKINVPQANTVDYLLVYNTSDGGQQGVPGTLKLTGGDLEKNLLLGSESSGKYRFDTGVSQGNITLTFRDGSGKSLGKVSSDFHLQTNETELTSVDGNFKYTLDKAAKGVYFVTMKTYLQPAEDSNVVVWKDGYGVFSSDGKPHNGK